MDRPAYFMLQWSWRLDDLYKQGSNPFFLSEMTNHPNSLLYWVVLPPALMEHVVDDGAWDSPIAVWDKFLPATGEELLRMGIANIDRQRPFKERD